MAVKRMQQIHICRRGISFKKLINGKVKVREGE